MGKQAHSMTPSPGEAFSLTGIHNFFFFGFEQHMLTDAIRVIYAFKRDTEVGGPDLYYANVASALSLVKTSLYLITTVLFDAFIVSVHALPSESVDIG